MKLDFSCSKVQKCRCYSKNKRKIKILPLVGRRPTFGPQPLPAWPASVLARTLRCLAPRPRPTRSRASPPRGCTPATPSVGWHPVAPVRAPAFKPSRAPPLCHFAHSTSPYSFSLAQAALVAPSCHHRRRAPPPPHLSTVQLAHSSALPPSSPLTRLHRHSHHGRDRLVAPPCRPSQSGSPEFTLRADMSVSSISFNLLLCFRSARARGWLACRSPAPSSPEPTWRR
jgi:hypothetical protein